ncbi:MAG: HAMP domain-containing histidine kinase, partial [Dactylosporangium sp.]|nr:HAMP domain-containing histidine kinase [Dactylosporangium sp.]NNJ60987.1 HAMP domain-containing histidine kinase [Dactylosporangium sp.]
IDDLLAYAAAPEAPLQLRPVDLDGLVNDAVSVRVNLLHHRAGPGGPPPIISVEPLPPVIADPVMLRRVVENLLDNAIKYTRPGEPAMVRVSARRQLAGQARVEMADRGIGIPEGQHDAVFTSFHRAHADAGYPGTGLGLATCQRIIARHGGTIGAQPNRGGGTRFWFTLPEAPAEDHRPVG